jgi:predicted acylesterase/phospholipase RssA
MAEGPGSFIATMAVPWRYDFQCANGRGDCPSAEQVVACRRWLYYGGSGEPCAGIPEDHNFVGLSLSGGGSRSAVLSAAIMFELDRLGILPNVDIVSSVSGGSLTAALYAASCDSDADCPENVLPEDRIIWKERDILELLEHDFITDWWFSLLANPSFLARFLFTYSARNDVMADTFADVLYSRSTSMFTPNDGLMFAQLNPRRPNLILGATDVTTSLEQPDLPGRCFQFTLEHFLGPGISGIVGERNIRSNIDDFPIAYAVTASNAFPGLFQYESLRDYSDASGGEERYVHLADGGIRDQVGLVPIHSILKAMLSRSGRLVDTCDITRGEDDRGESTSITDGRRIVLFDVDAATPPRGWDEHDPDARAGVVDRLLPYRKSLDAVDTILDDQRALRAREYFETREKLTAALGGDPYCCVVVAFTVHDYLKRLGPKTRPGVHRYPIQKIDPDLYRRITTDMPIGLDLSKANLCVLRRAARELVARMTEELCTDGQLLDTGIACVTSRAADPDDEYPCDDRAAS